MLICPEAMRGVLRRCPSEPLVTVSILFYFLWELYTGFCFLCAPGHEKDAKLLPYGPLPIEFIFGECPGHSLNSSLWSMGFFLWRSKMLTLGHFSPKLVGARVLDCAALGKV